MVLGRKTCQRPHSLWPRLKVDFSLSWAEEPARHLWPRRGELALGYKVGAARAGGIDPDVWIPR